jgi:hypothetical protein
MRCAVERSPPIGFELLHRFHNHLDEDCALIERPRRFFDQANQRIIAVLEPLLITHGPAMTSAIGVLALRLFTLLDVVHITSLW